MRFTSTKRWQWTFQKSLFPQVFPPPKPDYKSNVWQVVGWDTPELSESYLRLSAKVLQTSESWFMVNRCPCPCPRPLHFLSLGRESYFIWFHRGGAGSLPNTALCQNKTGVYLIALAIEQYYSKPAKAHPNRNTGVLHLVSLCLCGPKDYLNNITFAT